MVVAVGSGSSSIAENATATDTGVVSVAQAAKRIRFLVEPTSQAWVEMAIANLDEILLDHSHCERKAASAALNLMFRYPSSTKLVHMLTAIAKEELEHFEQVNQWLERRGVPLAPLNAPPYGGKLKALVRRQEPERMLDFLLVSGLIEARSHERLGLIAEHCPDPELAAFLSGVDGIGGPSLRGVLGISRYVF